MVRKLLDARADVNAADDRDRTALMMAAGEGDVRVATALLEMGADPHLVAMGRTALHFAYMPKSNPESTEASNHIRWTKWFDICNKDAVGKSLIIEYGMNPMAQLLTNHHAREQNADAPSRQVNSHRVGIANAV